ncbi:hypothetical protein OS493_004441 [Desmophyllum pertusum]|uniref:Uncharacterized protein n=1 Tax=Desmophyllum pertusum TaxID=174260 RepID=A0A9W9ZUQ9_9CNID|nr:hypothetical protein OS493_004441 [Desmophyllum pertusum]
MDTSSSSSSSSNNNNNNNNSNTNNHNNNNNNNSSSNSRRSRSSNSSRNSLTSDTIDKSTTTTDQCQTDSTADTKAKSSIEDPIPAALETFSGYYVLNGLNSRQAGARPIVPAPTQSVNICSDDPATDASANSSCCSNSTVYPIIVNSFSINESIRSAVAHQGFNYQPLETEEQPRSSNTDFTPSQNSPPPQVNREYFPSPNSHQTGHSDFIALDNTVLMQAFSLEKFYSFSAPEKQARAPRLRPQTRHYKATRTNFSRLSLEPICSVIHPLTSSTHQSTSQKSAAEVAAQRAWGWWIR